MIAILTQEVRAIAQKINFTSQNHNTSKTFLETQIGLHYTIIQLCTNHIIPKYDASIKNPKNKPNQLAKLITKCNVGTFLQK